MRKWGQHFLTDKNILNDIVKAADLTGNIPVLEIGPGRGALTALLIKHTQKVLAVEIDPALCDFLKNKFKDSVHVVQKNILHVTNREIDAVLGDRWRVIGNLPFYITSPILNTIFSWDSWDQAVLTVQNEVADRLAAQAGTKAYGILSIAAQMYAVVEKLFVIPRQVFKPKPRVDAALVKLIKRDQPLVAQEDQESFFTMLKMCFSARRKMLVNSVSRGLSLNKKDARDLLDQAEIDFRRRPETVTLNEFKLFHRLTMRKKIWYNEISARDNRSCN